jgi:hypothetical protein
MKSKLKNIAITAAITTLLCVFVASVQSVHAATITVNSTADSGAGTLRDALTAASGGDTINFSVATPATITLTTGQLLVSISVTIIGPGPGNLAVNGNHAGRLFYIAPSNTVSISGLTITNGFTDFGGGIKNDYATLTVSNCIVSGNNASTAGGGIHNNADHSYGAGSATLLVINSTLSGNMANNAGGGIENFGASWGPSLGSATLTVSNCTLNGNSGPNGGGIDNDGHGTAGSATATIVNSLFFGNSGFVGGGVSNDGGSGYGFAEISNCTFSTNSAANGGAIFNTGGGGIGGVIISSSTLSGNDAQTGGSICNNSSGSVVIHNTLFKVAATKQSIFNDSDPAKVISLGYNLCNDAGGGVLTNATDQINTDPLLDVLRDNGGPTLTHALLTGSPAINAGDPGFTSSPDFDQRGPGFVRVVCGRIDIGAFEAQTLPAVLSLPTYLAGTGYHFSVAGLACLNYIVQASTNLAASNWVSLATNAPPFTFVDTNADNYVKRFYRAVYWP